MKKVFKLTLLLISILLVNYTVVNASTNTYERTENNLGVNKKWTINDSNMDNVLNTYKVDASEKIYDFAEIFDEETEELIYDDILNKISMINMDIVVLTTNLDYDKYQLEDYAADFYDYNDFGLDYKLYDGVILIINMNENNRFYNIFTFGNGQLYFPFSRCESILDNMQSSMINGNYLDAVSLFTKNVYEYYDQGIPNENKNSYIDDMGNIRKRYSAPYLLALIIATIVTIIVISILLAKNKMVKKAKTANEYKDSANSMYTKKLNDLVSTHTTSYVVDTSSGGGSGGGSSIGSSGGGHGGGGGRSF